MLVTVVASAAATTAATALSDTISIFICSQCAELAWCCIGFSLFMSVSKPRPSDQPIIVLFVVGGVTSTEARKITEAAGHGASQVR